MSPAQAFAVCLLCVAANLAAIFVLGSTPILWAAAAICAVIAATHLARWMA